MRQDFGGRRLRCVLVTKHSSSRLKPTLTPVVNGRDAFSLSCLSKRLRAAWEERSESGFELGVSGLEVEAASLSPDSPSCTSLADIVSFPTRSLNEGASPL